MTGTGQSGVGSAGSEFDCEGDTRHFPGVPFSEEHFTPRENCPSGDGKGMDFRRGLGSHGVIFNT